MRSFPGRAQFDFFAGFALPPAQTHVGAHREGRDKLFCDAPALLIFRRSAL
jgi:hypothetical protein